ncbi:MAG: hypothetical protein EBU70_11170 [Actinobacteria bacterium]|nr:hypothetical protein [Actinomycetota bacterium]
MKRTVLSVACLACIALASCGDSGGKKPVTKRDQSNVPKYQGGAAETKSKMIEGEDPARKP